MESAHPAVEQLFQSASQHHRARELLQAEEACRKILSTQPDHAEAHHLLGMVLSQRGHAEEGIAHFHAAASLRPGDAGFRVNFGNALAGMGRIDEAIVCFRQALELRPDFAEAWNNLGNALQEKRDAAGAIAAHRRAIELRPDFAAAYYNLGAARGLSGDLDAAVDAYDHAIELRPHYVEAEVNRANILKDIGRLDDAIAGFRRAMQLKPAPQTSSNLIFALSAHPSFGAKNIHKELVRYNELFVRPVARSLSIHDNDRSSNRRLRIGYVSPDFSSHPIGRFVLPLLAHHDDSYYQVFCYSDVRRPDAITQRLVSHTHFWRDARNLSHRQLADLIRRDAIDILVDLTMHTAPNRLMTFAHKPAPVQVTWLGYPGSSGIETMDWRISDNHLDPPGMNDAFYSERTIRLPDCYWCYDPLVERMDVDALPAKANGFVTFGCLNNFGKVTGPTLDLWGRVLSRVPNSRLLVLAPRGSARRLLQARMQQSGVAETRVEFTDRLPRESYMELYHRIDISLDTFPYNGHTTSFDSLWMGVPVVSLFGTTAVSRAGLSILANLGVCEWATDDSRRFVDIVTDLAGDLTKLSEIRATLRMRMERSPLMDQPRFSRNIESLYRQMWESWCKSV